MVRTQIFSKNWLTRICLYQGVRNVSFAENFVYVLNKWSRVWFTTSRVSAALNLRFIPGKILIAQDTWMRRSVKSYIYWSWAPIYDNFPCWQHLFRFIINLSRMAISLPRYLTTKAALICNNLGDIIKLIQSKDSSLTFYCKIIASPEFHPRSMTTSNWKSSLNYSNLYFELLHLGKNNVIWPLTKSVVFTPIFE